MRSLLCNSDGLKVSVEIGVTTLFFALLPGVIDAHGYSDTLRFLIVGTQLEAEIPKFPISLPKVT